MLKMSLQKSNILNCWRALVRCDQVQTNERSAGGQNGKLHPATGSVYRSFVTAVNSGNLEAKDALEGLEGWGVG